jgi:hypothetical protein
MLDSIWLLKWIDVGLWDHSLFRTRPAGSLDSPGGRRPAQRSMFVHGRIQTVRRIPLKQPETPHSDDRPPSGSAMECIRHPYPPQPGHRHLP